MDNRLKEAFDSVRAEEELKQSTKEFLRKKLYTEENRQIRYQHRYSRKLAVLAACFFLVIIGGGSTYYFKPVSAISIDVNPSIEFNINRFDRVISVKGYNEDGNRLAGQLNVRFMEYTKAIDAVLSNERIVEYLEEDEQLSITVIGDNDRKNREMLANINTCTAGHKNIHCHSANSEEAEEAHEFGLSCGKYKKLLELQALDPTITAEDIKGLTMAEIKEWIETLSEDGKNKERSEKMDTDKESGCERNRNHGGHGKHGRHGGEHN